MKLQLVSLLTVLTVAHGAWAPSLVAPQRAANAAAVQSSQSKSALYMGSSNNATDNPEQTPTVVPQPQLDPEAFTNDMNRELEDLSSLVEEANAPKYDPTPVEAYDKALKDIKLQDSNPVTKSNKPKGFGETAKKSSKNKSNKNKNAKINIGNQIVEQARQDKDTKTPRQLIMEAKQAKAQNIQKITPEEQVPKQEKSIFNPVAQPYLKKPLGDEQPKKSYFPPTPIAKKPDTSTVKVTTATASTNKQQKTYFPPTPMDKKPQVQEKVETPIEDPIPQPMEAVMDSAVKETVATTSTSTPKKQQKKNKKLQLPKMEIPKIEIPKDTVDQAVGLAKKTGGAILDTVQVVAKEGADWANQVKDNLNTTKVEDLDMTYQEAFEKVAQGGRGFIKICSILATALKDTVTFFADEVQRNQKNPPQLPSFDAFKTKATTAAATTPRADKPKKVIPTPKPKAESASSYLDQLETKSFVKPTGTTERKRLNLRDIVLPKPVLPEEPTTSISEEQVLEAPLKETSTKAATPAKAKQDLGEIQSKAESMLGNLWSSASAAMKEVQAKAQDETIKFKASVGELKENTFATAATTNEQEEDTTETEEEVQENKGKVIDTAPKMSKTQPVKARKNKKGPWFFLSRD